MNRILHDFIQCVSSECVRKNFVPRNLSSDVGPSLRMGDPLRRYAKLYTDRFSMA